MLQSTLDFLEHGYELHVLVDGGCIVLQQGGGPVVKGRSNAKVGLGARCVLHDLSLGWVRSSVCHLVDASCPNFKAFAT